MDEADQIDDNRPESARQTLCWKLGRMDHCLTKIEEIVARGDDDRRSVLQLGYNLGRLSELTGRGREPFWDRWKDAVADWNLPALRDLANGLRRDIEESTR